jgi:hypothetical protein
MSHRTATQLHIPALVLVLQEQEGVRSPLELLLGLVAISTRFPELLCLEKVSYFDVHVPVYIYAADLE